MHSVLLVDDDPDARTTIRFLLDELDVDVSEAESGSAALEYLKTDRPSLVLLDFDMPGLDGVETLKQIRKCHTNADLPVLMLSGRQDSDIIVSALDEGANDYIGKLTDPPVLLARVRRHLVKRGLEGLPSLGPYRLGERIGEGLSSTVFKAYRGEDLVAVKVLKPGLRLDTNMVLPEVAHPGVVSPLELVSGDADYVVYPYRGGVELDRYPSRSVSSTLELLLEVLNALQAIHDAGALHRDLKPSSIRIDDEDRPHLLDYGFNPRIVRENALSATGPVTGHPAYLAPELLLDPEAVGVASDLYAFGALTYLAATGRPPFEGSLSELLHQVLEEPPPRPSQLRPDGVRLFDFVCLKLLAKEPSRRYQSCEEVKQKLLELAEEARRPTVPPG